MCIPAHADVSQVSLVGGHGVKSTAMIIRDNDDFH